MNNFLKQVRTLKQLTLKELADKTGISFSTIGNYETGKRGISDEYLKKIATALQVPVSEIAPPRHVIEMSDGFKKDSLEVEPVMKGQSIRGLHTAPMEAL